MRKIPPPYADPTPLFRHGGAVDRGGPPLLDFSASVNPLGPPESVLRALRDRLPEVARYPDPECRELTDRLAALHRVDPACVVVGNGSNELIDAVARALRPKRVAIAEPTYTEYLRASLRVGAEVDHWLAEGDRFTFAPFDPGGADVVWLCDPNSPTGGGWPIENARRWVENTRATFVVDEAFRPLLPPFDWDDDIDFSRSTWVWRAAHLPNLVVLRSLTKYFGFPGLRLGYAVACPPLAARIRAERVPWSVGGLALAAGLVALDDRDFAERTHAWIMTRWPPRPSPENDFFRGLAEAGPPMATQSSLPFALCRLENGSAKRLTARLAARGIAVRDASNFVGLDDRYVRVSMRTAADNERLFAALRESVD